MKFVNCLFLCLLVAQAVQSGGKDKEPAGTAKDGTIHLEGYVFDSGRKPIGGVEVAVHVLGKADSVKSVKTDVATGKYMLDVKVTGAFELSFTQSRYAFSFVSHLADKNNQMISKVLYRRGEMVPASAALDYLHATERILLFTAHLPSDKRLAFLNHFEPDGGAFKLVEPLNVMGAKDRPMVMEFLSERHKATRVMVERFLYGK